MAVAGTLLSQIASQAVQAFAAAAPTVLSSVAGSGGLFSKAKDVTNYAKQAKYTTQVNKALNKQNYKLAVKYMRKQNKLNNLQMSNSAKATQALNQNLMDYQYALERQSRQNAYVDTRKDLESAGYNPLLAVGQQSGYVNVGSGVSTQSGALENNQLANSAVDMASAFNSMKNENATVKQSAQRLANDILSSKFNNDLTSAQAEKARSETRGQDISNTIEGILGMTRAESQIENIGMSTKQMKQAIENSIQQLKNETRVANSTSALNYAKVNEAIEQTKGMKSQNKVNSNQAKFWNSGYGKFIYGAQQTTGAIGNILSGSAGYSVSTKK